MVPKSAFHEDFHHKKESNKITRNMEQKTASEGPESGYEEVDFLNLQNERLKELKILVRSLLVPYKNGLTVHKLCEEYRQCEGHYIPYDSLGFNSTEDLLLSIKDVLRFDVNDNGERVLKAVADENCRHIQSLVGEQRENAERTPYFVDALVQRRSHRRSRRRIPFLPALIRRNIAMLLYQHEKGVHLSVFPMIYEYMFGEPFDETVYGFNDLDECLGSIVTICTVDDTAGSYTPMIYINERLYKYLKEHKDVADAFECYSMREVFEKVFDKSENGVVLASRFCSEFKKMYFCEMNPTFWGYRTPIELFRSLPSVFYIVPAEEVGSYREALQLTIPDCEEGDHVLLHVESLPLKVREELLLNSDDGDSIFEVEM